MVDLLKYVRSMITDNGYLSSDDILEMEEQAGRCYRCHYLEDLSDLHEVQVDTPGNFIFLCPSCLEHEQSR